MREREPLKPPFNWPGGKRHIAHVIWERLGEVHHYIEPFLGGAAVLLAAPRVAAIEVVGDINGYIANFWRAVRSDPDAVVTWADYPMSHIDQIGRHKWLLAQRERICAELADPDWPGDVKVAGWWMWGQRSWIGSGWCDGGGSINQIPKIGATRNAMHVSRQMMSALSKRLTDVRLIHGDWRRTLNSSHGLQDAHVLGIVIDPPYRGYESIYSSVPVADEVETWCIETDHLRRRVALCGHVGDYPRLSHWAQYQWSRPRPGLAGSSKTRHNECVWFSPACLAQRDIVGPLFAEAT